MKQSHPGLTGAPPLSLLPTGGLRTWLHDGEEADATRSLSYYSFSQKLKIQPLYGKLSCKVSQADEIYSIKQKKLANIVMST